MKGSKEKLKSRYNPKRHVSEMELERLVYQIEQGQVDNTLYALVTLNQHSRIGKLFEDSWMISN